MKEINTFEIWVKRIKDGQETEKLILSTPRVQLFRSSFEAVAKDEIFGDLKVKIRCVEEDGSIGEPETFYEEEGNDEVANKCAYTALVDHDFEEVGKFNRLADARMKAYQLGKWRLIQDAWPYLVGPNKLLFDDQAKHIVLKRAGCDVPLYVISGWKNDEPHTTNSEVYTIDQFRTELDKYQYGVEVYVVDSAKKIYSEDDSYPWVKNDSSTFYLMATSELEEIEHCEDGREIFYKYRYKMDDLSMKFYKDYQSARSDLVSLITSYGTHHSWNKKTERFIRVSKQFMDSRLSAFIRWGID